MTGQVSIAAAQQVRAVLWAWDPIGVRAIGQAWPQDEYDDLIEPLLMTLAHAPRLEELAAGLHELLITQYGLPSPHGCSSAAADLLQLPARDSVSSA